MSLGFLDPYIEDDSRLHTLDARVKVTVALALIVAINFTSVESWLSHAGYLMIVLAVAAMGRLRLRVLLGRSMLALPFALMAAIGLPFVQEGSVLTSLALPWGTLKVTDVGLARFASVMLKSWLSMLVSVTLILSTHFLDIAHSLQSLGLPKILVSVILLMYRYIHVLVEEVYRLMRARDARSGEMDGVRSGGSLLWRAQVTGGMIGTLFLRTYERSERIYAAMLARGYSGEIRVLQVRGLTWREKALVAGSVAALLLVGPVASLWR